MGATVEQPIPALCWLILVVFWFVVYVSGYAEGDALNALKTNLADPNKVLQSWDPTLVNPCTWFHVNCNPEGSVTRLDLGNSSLSGQLVSQLGQLKNLQYFLCSSSRGMILIVELSLPE